MTVLNSRFGNLCLLSLVILASVHLVTGEEPKDKQSFKLDYFKQTMFVTAVSTGSGVFSSEDIFILDTGTNRSSLDREIANFLGLVCSGSTTDYRQTASVHRSTCLLPQLSALGRSVSNLTVVAEDNFTAYRVAYRRHVVGIIGMDFLENSVLVIDFPERTLEFLRDRSKIRLHRPTTIQMKRVHDLPLVAIGSPAGEQFDLLFDTGEDSPADAILFKPLIQFLTMGKRKIAPASVGLTDTASIQAAFLHHVGTIGLFAFDKGRLVIDFKKNQLSFSGSLARKECRTAEAGVCKF